jgi:hypothetical protein
MRILDQEINFKQNLLYSLRRYPLWWLILLITMCFDFLSTVVFVAEYGTRAEANLTTRLMMENFNPYLGNLAGKLLQLMSVLCLVGLTRRVGNFFMLFVILLNCWAIVMNSILV